MFKKFLLLAIIISFTLTGCYTQIAEDTPDDILYENTHTTAVPGVGDKVDLSNDNSGFSGNYVGSDTSFYTDKDGKLTIIDNYYETVKYIKYLNSESLESKFIGADTTAFTDSSGDVIVINNYYERLQYIGSMGNENPESNTVLVGYFPPTTYYVAPFYPNIVTVNWNYGWGSSWYGYWGGWNYPCYWYWDYYPWYGYPTPYYHRPSYVYWDGGYYSPSPYRYRRDYVGNARDRGGRGYADRRDGNRTRPSSYDSNRRSSTVASRGDSRGGSRSDDILSRLPRAARDGRSSARSASATSRSAKNRIADSRGTRIDSETLKQIRNNPRYKDKGNIKSNSREAALISARNKKLAEMGKSRSGNIRDSKSNRGISTYKEKNSSRNVSGRTTSTRSTPKTLTPKRSYTKSSASSSSSSSYKSGSSNSSSSSSSYSRPSSSGSSRSGSSYSRPSSSGSSRSGSSYSRPSSSSSSRSGSSYSRPSSSSSSRSSGSSSRSSSGSRSSGSRRR